MTLALITNSLDVFIGSDIILGINWWDKWKKCGSECNFILMCLPSSKIELCIMEYGIECVDFIKKHNKMCLT